MGRTSVYLWIGVALIVIGGGMLAFGGWDIGPPVGSTFGIAGIGLLAWAWLSRGGSRR